MPDNGLGELERLTNGERLLVDRRRRGETQGEAARRHGVTYFVYGQAERDKSYFGASFPRIDRLRPHERCLLYRRRSGDTQLHVANNLKMCRWWVNQMERGDVPCDDLISYWEQ